MRSSEDLDWLSALIARCTSIAQRSAASALPNSSSIPSPAVLTIRPPCSAIFGSMMRSRITRSRANAPASSGSMCRLKPTTSAIRIAASLRVTALRFTVVPVAIENDETKP
jgi:hypothetical protein